MVTINPRKQSTSLSSYMTSINQNDSNKIKKAQMVDEDVTAAFNLNNEGNKVLLYEGDYFYRHSFHEKLKLMQNSKYLNSWNKYFSFRRLCQQNKNKRYESKNHLSLPFISNYNINTNNQIKHVPKISQNLSRLSLDSSFNSQQKYNTNNKKKRPNITHKIVVKEENYKIPSNFSIRKSGNKKILKIETINQELNKEYTENKNDTRFMKYILSKIKTDQDMNPFKKIYLKIYEKL